MKPFAWFLAFVAVATLSAQQPIINQGALPIISGSGGGSGGTAADITVGTTTITGGTNGRVLYDNAGVLGEMTTTGSGTVLALATAPVFPTTITLGAASGTTGSALLKGTTSGTVTLSVADAAGTWTYKLPTGAGTADFAQITDGSGNASWVTGQSIAGLKTTSAPQFARLGLGAAADATQPLYISGSGQTAGGIRFVDGSGTIAQIFPSGGINFQIGTSSNHPIQFFTNNANTWTMQADGDWVATTDGGVNIGDSGALRPGFVNVKTGIRLGANLTWSATAPTIASGFNTSPSITNGTATAFLMDTGTTAATNTGVVTLPAATNGWHCTANDLSDAVNVWQVASTTTSASFKAYSKTTGLAVNWPASVGISIGCTAR